MYRSGKILGPREARRAEREEVVGTPETVEEVSDRDRHGEDLCGECLDWFPAEECQNYIRHAGYGPQQ